jgi:hypothetical protein
VKELNAADSWESISKRASWDREVSLDVWREKVREGHRSYLPDAITAMSAPQFVHFYGVERFLLDWPAMRARLPAAVAVKSGMYDLVWSKLAGGGWNLKPAPDYYLMPRRRREFLVNVARAPGQSIYQAAKSLHMQYRRAHDHAMTLAREGKIRTVEAVEGGHRKLKLFPSYRPDSNLCLPPS